MFALLFLVLGLLTSPFKSTSRLEAENAALRQQLIVLQRKFRGRTKLTNGDRLFFVLLYRLFPSVLKVMVIVQPETLVRWHRAGFRRYWRWKSRNLGGRPPIEAELRTLIRRISAENVLWGAPRIQGELLKLGFTVANRRSQNIWSEGKAHLGRAGERFSATTHRTLPRWICSWYQPLPSSSFMF